MTKCRETGKIRNINGAIKGSEARTSSDILG